VKEAISPDGEWVAAGTRIAEAVEFSPDGKCLATAGHLPHSRGEAMSKGVRESA